MVTKNILRVGYMPFLAKKNLDQNNCLKQIKLPRSFHNCAPISELLSNISTMNFNI